MASKLQHTETDQLNYDEYEQTESNCKYVKRAGASGIGGQIYEIYFCILMLLLLKEKDDIIEEFYLGSSVETSADLDDVLLKIEYKKTCRSKPCQILFLQAKHRQNLDKAKKISLDTLLSSEKGDFSMKKYFRSYRTIKQNFEKENFDDPIFKSDFGDCHFVIYTNSLANEKFDRRPNVKKIKAESNSILNFDKGCYYYQLTVEENLDETNKIKEILKDTSDCRTLAKELVKCIRNEGDSTEDFKLMRKYHSALSKVLKTGEFRDDFIEGADTLSPDEKIFRNEFFNELKNSYSSEQDMRFLKGHKIQYFNNFKATGVCDSSLPVDVVKDEEIQDFLNKFKLFIGQPDKEQLELVIKSRIKSTYKIPSNDITTIFSEVKHKVGNWWEKGDFYLTKKNNTYFEDAVRISIWYNVNRPIEPFTGREKELKTLHNYIQRNPLNSTVISQMTSICGLGGIGKTELARKYAYEYSKAYDNNVIWINADTEETLKESFTTLAKDKLQISTKDYDGGNRNISNVVADIYNYFSKRKCLFIFDNADHNPFLYDFLPLNCLNSDDQKPFVLVTSRNQDWDEEIEVLRLDEFSMKEAKDFLKTSLKTDRDEDEAVTQLITKLQRFPLALQQAAAYINSERKIYNAEYTVHDYLVEYENQTRKLLDFKKLSGINNRYSQTTFTTWKISIRKILEDEEFGLQAMKIFNMIAYCSPEKIPLQLFLQSTDGDNRQLRGVIHLISKYSLIKTYNDHFSVHRLVQEVTRLNLIGKEMTVLTVLLDSIEISFSNEVIEHATYAWKYANEYDELIIRYFSLWGKVIFRLIELNQLKTASSLAGVLNNKTENEYDAIIRQKSQLLNARVIHCLGRYNEAKEMYRNILEKFNRELGSHPNMLYTELLLNDLIISEGKYEEGSKKISSVISKCIQQFGKKHHFTLSARRLLAHSLEIQQKNDEAITAYDQIFKIFVKMLGRQHPDTLRVQCGKAAAIRQKGNYDEAVSIFNELFEIRSRILPTEHLDTLKTLEQIAITMYAQGKFEDAAKLFENILKRISTTFGDDHPYALKLQNNVALAIHGQSKYEEALNISQEVFKKSIAVLGENHLDTLNAEHTTALSLVGQIKYEEGNEALQNLYKKQKKILGEEHLNTLLTQRNLGVLFLKQKMYEEAMLTFNEVLPKYTRLLGKDHHITLDVEHCRASVQFTLERYPRNLSYKMASQKIVDVRTRTLGQDHSDTLAIQHQLTVILIHIKRYDKAMNIIRNIFKTYKKMVHKDHHKTLTIECKKANILWEQGKFDEAFNMYNEISRKCNRIIGRPLEKHICNILNRI